MATIPGTDFLKGHTPAVISNETSPDYVRNIMNPSGLAINAIKEFPKELTKTVGAIGKGIAREALGTAASYTLDPYYLATQGEPTPATSVPGIGEVKTVGRRAIDYAEKDGELAGGVRALSEGIGGSATLLGLSAVALPTPSKDITLYRGENTTNVGGVHFAYSKEEAAKFGGKIIEAKMPKTGVLDMNSPEAQKIVQDAGKKLLPYDKMLQSFWDKGYQAITTTDQITGKPTVILNPNHHLPEVKTVIEAINRHLTSSKQIVKEMSQTKQFAPPDLMNQLVSRLKTNIVDGLKRDGHETAATKIASLDPSIFKSLDAFATTAKDLSTQTIRDGATSGAAKSIPQALQDAALGLASPALNSKLTQAKDFFAPDAEAQELPTYVLTGETNSQGQPIISPAKPEQIQSMSGQFMMIRKLTDPKTGKPTGETARIAFPNKEMFDAYVKQHPGVLKEFQDYANKQAKTSGAPSNASAPGVRPTPLAPAVKNTTSSNIQTKDLFTGKPTDIALDFTKKEGLDAIQSLLDLETYAKSDTQRESISQDIDSILSQLTKKTDKKSIEQVSKMIQTSRSAPRVADSKKYADAFERMLKSQLGVFYSEDDKARLMKLIEAAQRPIKKPQSKKQDTTTISPQTEIIEDIGVVVPKLASQKESTTPESRQFASQSTFAPASFATDDADDSFWEFLQELGREFKEKGTQEYEEFKQRLKQMFD